MIESNSYHRCEPSVPHLEIAARRQLEDVGTSRSDWERREVAEEKVSVISDSSRANPGLAGRRNIHHTMNLARRWRDAIDLLVIWLCRIQVSPNRDHAVPGSIRLPVFK